MEKILAENVKRLCKEQNKQLKDLAADMGIDLRVSIVQCMVMLD